MTAILGSWITLWASTGGLRRSLRPTAVVEARRSPPHAAQSGAPSHNCPWMTWSPVSPWQMRRQRSVDAGLGSSLPTTASVREYVLIGPACKVELGALGQERKACCSERLTALAREHAVEA